MPFLDLTTHRLHYRVSGPEGRPWLTFCNSLGTDLHMWDEQFAAFESRFRILRYDRRGHGASTAPAGVYDIADLGRDVLALWDGLGIERTHFCGLSIGGLTGQWLGVHAGQRLERLVVCATAAKIGTLESWQERIRQVQAGGLLPLAEGTVQRWFRPGFVSAHPLVVDEIVGSFLATSPDGYIGCCNAVAGADFRGQLAGISVPLLAIAGDDDPVCPPAELRHIAGGVADGRFAQVPGRHICNLESPQPFNALLREFLQA
ncbi:MAG TPA: 3-oxoadipate enol-lactonase [Xanthomonadaceae bacterium]|nr:3-oxoadipate enol-lactonase [Xanthomonadaceae bacterium]